MDPIRILIADDHPLVRDGLQSFLQKQPGFLVVGEAENGEQLLTSVAEYHPDVVLLDVTMPRMNGLQALEALRLQAPQLKVIILTMHEEPEYILKSISNGAKGYLLKNVELSELRQAIETVADGGKYFPPSVSEIVLENLGKQAPEPTQALTPRELEILRKVGEGLSNHQIAYQLFISTRTVEKHRVNLLRKMQAANTAELVRKAAERGLLD